jgi:hypothetical protein
VPAEEKCKSCGYPKAKHPIFEFNDSNMTENPVITAKCLVFDGLTPAQMASVAFSAFREEDK